MEAIDGYITITPGVTGGKPRISGRRITVQQIVVWHEQMGFSADEIATLYGLSLAEIYAALAYYHGHREAIDAAIVESDSFIKELREKAPSLLARRLYEREG